MAQIELSVEKRSIGKGVSRALRREGFVPAILYGKGEAGTPLKVSTRDIKKVLSEASGTVVAQLTVAGENDPHYVIVKEVQVHPLRRSIVHVDFQEISMTEKVRATVPITTTGDDAVIASGGVPQQIVREVQVDCLPAAIPERFWLDVSALTIGDQATLADLEVPEGVELVDDLSEVVFTVNVPRAIEEIEVTDEEAAEGEGEGEGVDGEPSESGEAEDTETEE